MKSSGDSANEAEAEVYHCHIFDEPDESPGIELVTTVADQKGVAPSDLNPLYSWADGLIKDLYSSPPPAEAQGVIEFSYEGFRIRLYQTGHAVLMGQYTSE